MSWQITFAQSLGSQSEQQDSGGAWLGADGNQLFALLADGAGGHRGGRQASETAVHVAHQLWLESPPIGDDIPAFLGQITQVAHDAIDALPESPHASRTTWLALVAGKTEAHWVHSGDSRLYHFAGGELASRTLDHSLVQMLVETGKLAASDMANHPDRSTLLQSLGGSKFHPPEFGSAPLTGNDCFILCTDGIWSRLTDDEFLSLAMCAADQRQARVDELVAEAVRRAGDRADNASLWCLSSAS
jgi:serine/threonine protein phosphatase PrpC